MQRSLRKMRHIHTVSKHKDVVILMDTTYWGRNSGLMVIKDAIRGKILWHKHVKHETITLYLEGIEWLENLRFGASFVMVLKAYLMHYLNTMCKCVKFINNV